MGKLIEFKKPTLPTVESEPEPSPLQVAITEIGNRYSEKEKKEMFEELDDDEKFNELLTSLEKPDA